MILSSQVRRRLSWNEAVYNAIMTAAYWRFRAEAVCPCGFCERRAHELNYDAAVLAYYTPAFRPLLKETRP